MTETILTSIKRRKILEVSECQICGSPALYLYFGVISCKPCAVFFKRNAEEQDKLFKCNFTNSCEINQINRRRCTYCRLTKCFKQGMTIKRIRGPRTNNNLIIESNQIVKFPCLNLLDRDISLLNKNQWILLTNLIFNYNESNTLLFAYQIENECHSSKRVNELIFQNFSASIYETTGNSLCSNNDITNLSSDDRSILLHTAADNIACFGAHFIMYQSQLINNRIFEDYLDNVYGKIGMNCHRWVSKFTESDIIIFKLSLSMFMFSTNSRIFHRNIENEYKNIRDILNIQNQYAEITWKYLLYKYGYQQAIRRFLRIIQSFLAISLFMSYAHDLTEHVNRVQSLIEETELTLILHDVDRIVENN